MTILGRRSALLALAVTLVVFSASLVLRPLWRDEYWALFFSGLGQPLDETIVAIQRDVHPPLYFVLLHFWRMIEAHELWARFFNVVVIALGGWSAWALRGSRGGETLTFLFLCATSYWILFYGVELRMMGMEFVLCALSVLVIRNVLDRSIGWLGGALVFFVLGILAASAHFFGALWFAVAGACTGFALLKRGQVAAFLVWGFATAAAIAPVAGWIILAAPQTNPPPLGPIADEFGSSLHQFSRGLIVKTLLGNIAATGAAILCLGGLMRRKDAFSLVILLSALATVVIAFVIHLFVVNMIKERAFIVMMPAVIYLIAQTIHSVRPDQKLAQQWIKAIPIVAIASLPLFAVEYFKDRERVGVVRAFISAHAAECAGQPIVAYLRPTAQAAAYSAYFTRTVLAGADNGRDLVLIDAAQLEAEGRTPPSSTCPLRAVALSLPRGEDAEHAEARRTLRAAGVDMDGLEERAIGGARGLMYVVPNMEDGGS